MICAVKSSTRMEFAALEVPNVADTPMARSMVVSNDATARSASVIGIGNTEYAVSDVPCLRWPRPRSAPAVPMAVTMPCHSISHGNFAAPDGVTMTEDRAMSPVMDKPRVPNQNPQVRLGVPVVEYSPRARIRIFDPRRSTPAGITDTGNASTDFLVVNVSNWAPRSVANG